MPPPLKAVLPPILEAYDKRHDLELVPIAVNKLRPIFELRGSVDRIIWEKVQFPSKYIAAEVQFYQQSMGPYSGDGLYALIRYSEALNFCWERFAICKEMYHTVLDGKAKARVTNTADLMRLAEALSQAPNAMSFPPFTTELDAEMLALETLFPYRLRKQHAEAYSDGKITAHQLALRYRIPEHYAEIGMLPTYVEWIGEQVSEF